MDATYLHFNATGELAGTLVSTYNFHVLSSFVLAG